MCDFIHDPDSIKQYRQSHNYFTRASALSFPLVVSSILHLFKESVEFNLHSIFDGFENKPVTGSAFTQARYKIKSDFFHDLNNKLKEGYNQANKKLWKGHFLIAGDGSTINLPSSNAIKDYFGIYSTTNKGTNCYLARTLFLYDVLNNYVINAQIGTMNQGEKTLLKKVLPNNYQSNTIFLLDRGFGHYCTLLEFKDKDFCVRISSASNFSKRMLKESSNDLITRWNPSEKEKENTTKNGLEIASLKIRVVKIKLNTGETELLVTSLLDQEKYSSEDINELYQYRWGVEEGFKNLKPKMKIEQFGARKPEGVFQEFFAHIFCMNLISLFGIEANRIIQKKTNQRQYNYQYNWKNAFRVVRSKIVDWISKADAGDLNERLIEIIARTMNAIIPNRTFVREARNMNKYKRNSEIYK